MAGGSVQKISQRSGGRRFSKRNGHRLMSEINVTPFVDVMLVLLIIFMVAAPLLTVGVEIDLPKTAAKALPAEKESPLTFLFLDSRSYVFRFSGIVSLLVVAFDPCESLRGEFYILNYLIKYILKIC